MLPEFKADFVVLINNNRLHLIWLEMIGILMNENVWIVFFPANAGCYKCW